MPVDTDGQRHWHGAEARAVPRPAPQPPVRPAAPAATAARRVSAALPPLEVLDPPPADTLAAAQTDRDDQLIAQSYVAGLQKTIFTASDILQAFLAGIAYVRQQAPTAPALEGTITSRTVVAALEFFLSQVLPQSSEEVRNGEWLPEADLRALIAEIREKGDLTSIAW